MLSHLTWGPASSWALRVHGLTGPGACANSQRVARTPARRTVGVSRPALLFNHINNASSALLTEPKLRWYCAAAANPSARSPFRTRLSGASERKRRREEANRATSAVKSQTKEEEAQKKGKGGEVPKEPSAAPPKPRRMRSLFKYGLMIAAVVGAWYIVKEANDNPSWWYRSSTKAPYVITPSGRKLAYNEYGNPLGKDVVLVFHDYMAGRTEIEALGLDAMLKEPRWANVRVIVIDRPGYGQSDPQRHRRLADWPEDVMRVATALRIDKFSIIGIGAGGLYALSCAEMIPAAQPGRLVNIALLATEAPRHDHFGMPIPTTISDQTREWRIQQMLARRFGHHGSAIHMGFYPTPAGSTTSPSQNVPANSHNSSSNSAFSFVTSAACNAFLRISNIILYSSSTPNIVFKTIYGSETNVLQARPELYKSVVSGAREAWSQGFHTIEDELAVTKDRGATAAVGYSHIQLAKGAHIAMWHGDRDQLVPLAMAANLAKIIPGARLQVCKGQGHLTCILHNWAAALDHVTSPPPIELEEICDNLKAEAKELNEIGHARKERVSGGTTEAAQSRTAPNLGPKSLENASLAS